MARKRLPPIDPREWLNRARSNLRRATSQREMQLFKVDPRPRFRAATRSQTSIVRLQAAALQDFISRGHKGNQDRRRVVAGLTNGVGKS